MVVDVGFVGMKRVPGPVARRPNKMAVNLSGDALRQHERLMGYQNEISRLSCDLGAALSSLSASNAEIDRLNAEVARLSSELEAEREKNARLSAAASQPRQSKKQKKDKGASDPAS